MKKIYIVAGLDCANCAYRLERGLSKDSRVEKASVDFSTKRLYITYKDKEIPFKELSLLTSTIDSGFKLSELDTNKKASTKIFTKELWILLIRIIISSVLMALGILGQYVFNWEMYIYIPIYSVALLIVLYDITWKFIKNVIHLQNPFDENLLLTIAAIGSFLLVLFGHPSFFEGVLVIILSQIGEIFESVATNKSRNAIQKAVDLRADKANLINGDNINVVHPSELAIGDHILIKVGEIIPVDGVVVSGEGSIDTSSLTGEFIPVNAQEGYLALSGCILKTGSIIMEVKKDFASSTASKILELVSSSGERKAKAEKFISKFAKVYTPIIFSLAIIIAIVPLSLLIFNVNVDASTWSDWIYRALCFLVIGCPCAIVISVPLAYFSGIGLSSKHGVVIKGANYLDRLCSISTIISDKTGTLTEGSFVIKKEVIQDGISKELFHEYLIAAESLSNHPIAKAIIGQENVQSFALLEQNYEEISGKGTTTTYKNVALVAGNYDFMVENKINVLKSQENGTIVYLSANKKYYGYVVLDDMIRSSAKQMIDLLHKKGIKIIMLTGDNDKHAQSVASELNVDSYKSQLMPDEKTKFIEEFMAPTKSKKSVVFMGDGINDAPSIIRADVGIAMGGVGSDAAVDNADIVIMNDDPLKIIDAINIAHWTRNKALFNIIVALAIKLALMILSTFGLVEMWMAVLADTGLTCLLVVNSLLLLYKKVRR